MADPTVSNLKSQVEKVAYNPAAIQRVVLESLRTATAGGVEVVDPTNPFVFALESSAVLTATAMAKNEANTRKQYPVAALTQEDLYLHMSDRDYADRFAVPAKTVFSILIPMEELLARLVEDPGTGIRKMVIPRNTFFTVADIVFSLQYPIEIRQMNHGGLQVVYDASKPSPLQELSSNVLRYETRTGPDGTDFLYFEFEVAQFRIQSHTGTLNAATDYKLDVTLADQYYYTRVYVEEASGSWTEIRTTHSDQIYDAATPTAVLRVIDRQLTVRIPQVYTSTGLLNRGVRVDVYETRGVLDINLANYGADAFLATWQAFDSADQTIFTAPLKTLRSPVIYSNKFVSGGANAMSFEALRNRVLRNAIGQPTLPITNVQLEATLERNGYQIVRNVDNITNRVFLATRPMPTPDDERLITAAAASIETVSITLDELVQLDTVIDNGASVTITPQTIYRTRSGVVKPVPSSQVEALLALPADQRAGQVTQGGYLYTPFHYVLDTTGSEFSARAYYLDAPTIETKIFVADNDTTLLQASTKAYGVERTESGYKITIALESSDGWKQLSNEDAYVMLAYVPKGERDRAYLMGALEGINADGERVYSFDLSTTFNVDAGHGMELSKFLMYSQEPRLTKCEMLQDFEVLIAAGSVMGGQYTPNGVDDALPRFLLPMRIAGVMHEKLRVRFGYSLDRLWSRARSVISTVVYKTWETDVPRFYEQDIYETDPLTGAKFGVAGDGTLTYNILHAKGDPVLDELGNPVYQFRKGDVQLDGSGNPIVLNPRGMMRQIDVLLIEGAYHFATDVTTLNYRNKLTRTVVEWLTNDLTKITEQLLEQTRMYFYPKTTLGAIDVMIQDGITTTIAAGQAFNVAIYVNAAVYSNEKLRAQLATTTVKVLSQQVASNTVSVSGMLKALREAYGNDVIDVDVNGLGGEANLSVLTVLNDGDRCSIRKRLIAQADDSLIVQEDVTIGFVRHELVQ